jgi:hypothetical protein
MNHNRGDLYAIQQNNVGVRCFMKSYNYEDTLIHFRQAMATKLANERDLLSQHDHVDQQPLYMMFNPNGNRSSSNIQRCVTPEPFDNESCTVNIENKMSLPPTKPHGNKITNQTSFQNISELHHLQPHTQYVTTTTTAAPSSVYIPYLYLNTFLLSDPKNQETNDSLPMINTMNLQSSPLSHQNSVAIQSTIISLVIILNLGILFHAINRSSVKAVAFYEIAMSLLHSLPTTVQDSLLLHIVVLNNYAVWCYENHEFDLMMQCFDEINELLLRDDDENANSNVTSTFDVTVKNGIRNNLREFLM